MCTVLLLLNHSLVLLRVSYTTQYVNIIVKSFNYVHEIDWTNSFSLVLERSAKSFPPYVTINLWGDVELKINVIESSLRGFSRVWYLLLHLPALSRITPGVPGC